MKTERIKNRRTQFAPMGLWTVLNSAFIYLYIIPVELKYLICYNYIYEKNIVIVFGVNRCICFCILYQQCQIKRKI